MFIQLQQKKERSCSSTGEFNNNMELGFVNRVDIQRYSFKEQEQLEYQERIYIRTCYYFCVDETSDMFNSWDILEQSSLCSRSGYEGTDHVSLCVVSS